MNDSTVRNRKKRVGSLRRVLILPLIALSLSAIGCGTMSNGRKWGEDAFSSVTWDRVSRSAYRALTDWQTLIPAAGAAIFSINDWDRKTADWAMDHRPIFGSERVARNYGDSVYTGFYLETFVTLLATPSGPDSKDWVNSKLKGMAVEGTALATTGLVTLGLREAIRRESPDGTKPTQFPSGHASLGWGAVALSNRNLDSISMSNGARLTMQASNYVLFTSMAWSRVEGGEHFPRDVLFGMALSNFLTAFIHDSLMGLPEQPRYWFSVEPQRGGMTVSLSFRY